MKLSDFGKPWTILKFNQDENTFRDHSGVLKNLFLHEKVKDRQVVVFSVIGSFRRGKSFFLDYCLRYLYSNYDSLNREDMPFQKKPQWMGHQDAKLSGFSWRSGAERDTTGIIFWSDVFLYTNQFDEKFAIFVVDTQGLFDNETTLMENSKIFALSSLISSIQVVNLNGNIREDELDYLQFAMEFARLAQKDDKKSKAFQELVFLVRDWQNEDDYEFGSIGGEKYMQHVLKLKNVKNQELNSVREFLIESCEKISCHLLPHPGKIVAGKKTFAGQWSLMDEDFREELFNSIEVLLCPQNLIVKKIGGRRVTAENYFIHLQNYFKFFASDELPTVTTIYQSLVEKDLDYLVEKYFKIYKKEMIEHEDNIVSEDQIKKCFKECKDATLTAFDNERKLGTAEHVENAENKLNEKIDEHFQNWEMMQLKFLKGQKAVQKMKTESDQLNELLAKERARNETNVRAMKTLQDALKDAKEKFDSEADEKRKLMTALNEIKKKLQIEENNRIEAENKAAREKLNSQKTISSLNSQLQEVQQKMERRSSSGPAHSTPLYVGMGGGSSLFESFSQAPERSYNYAPSAASYSSSSSRSANPWNQFQSEFSSTWRGMSASEKRSAGNFQSAASRAYRARK